MTSEVLHPCVSAGLPRPPGARRRLYVHIGMHKTGTTAIQAFCAKNRSELAEHGYFYPVTELDAVHHYLIAVACATTKKMRDELLNGLDAGTLAQITGMLKNDVFLHLKTQFSKGENDIILSSEAFYLLDGPSVDNFGQCFSDFDIVPLFFYRNFSDWLNSSYNTYVLSSGGHQNISDVGFTPFYFKDYAELWSKISATGKLKFVGYDTTRSKSQSIVDVFLREIGVVNWAYGSIQNEYENVSYRPDILVAAREMRKAGAEQSEIVEFAKACLSLDKAGRQHLLSPDEISSYDRDFSKTMMGVLNSGLADGISLADCIVPPRSFDDIILIRNLPDALISIGGSITSLAIDRDKTVDELKGTLSQLSSELMAANNELAAYKANLAPSQYDGFLRKAALAVFAKIQPFLGNVPRPAN
jgi:hypothetical protein